MELEDIRKEAERLWNAGENKALFDFLYENRKGFVEKDNDLGYTYFLSAVDKDNLDIYGQHGILYSGENLTESLANVYALKKLIHRIEWCEETDPAEVLSYMKAFKTTAIDLNWLINASALNPEYVLGRISGKSVEKRENNPQTDYYSPDKNYEGVEIAFVICTNDEVELEEAKYYINRLYVPDGCEVSVLAIYDAPCICNGYNEAIDCSAAKYKVYMHHDVRIIDRYFLYYIINIFENNPEIGILGMIGTKNMPSTGIMWDDVRYGAWIECHVNTCVSLSQFPANRITEVKLADGFLLATAQDIRWREDLFDGWDFYDASQCMEFRLKGYKVAVPYQKNPWCLHDCGYMNLSNHDKYRDVFLKTYGERS
ncbi:glycosyltransferase family protein [Butyrivibrio fibrisolvens]|uniref:glycosyltransferase family protein n=1 Tax=Butyrivibrio fibrisolvens TaxID=831 RepID=UPI0003FEC5DB|nr:glycosyltransferase family protein [Butyrivibrio fibrisolvens]